MSELSDALERILLGWHPKRPDPQSWDDGYRQAIEDMRGACHMIQTMDATEHQVARAFAANALWMISRVQQKRLGKE